MSPNTRLPQSDPENGGQSQALIAMGNGESGFGDSGSVATKARPRKAKVKGSPRARTAKAPKAEKLPKVKAEKKQDATPTAGKAASAPGGIYRAAQLLKMISEPSRVAIVLMLSENGSTNVTAMCQELGQGQPATSHHLALLRHSGVLIPTRDGKHNFYSLTAQGEELAGLIKTLIGDES